MSFKRQLADLESQVAVVQRQRPTSELAADRVAFAEVLGLQPDPWQAELLRSDSRRDLLNCSRQSGKSTIAAVLALHEALYVPGSVTVLISPSQRQSSLLFKKVVEFRERLPFRPELSEDNKLSMHVRGGGGVLSLPGSEATVRGVSAVTLLIEDEAARVADHLHQALRPMLATTNGRFIMMSTPFGKRGHFWNAWDDEDGWNKVLITAKQVARIAPEWLEEERRRIPAWDFDQEYMCVFNESVDSVFAYGDVMGAMSEDVAPLFRESK